MSFPQIIFEQAIASFKPTIPSDSLDILKSLFLDICPSFLNLISKTLIVFPTPQNIHSLINDIFPFRSLGLCFSYWNESQVDDSDSISIRSLLVHSLFIAFTSIIEPSSYSNYEQTVKGTYFLRILDDWQDLSLPKGFWDIFTRPSLFSLRFVAHNFISYDTSLLQIEPIVDGSPDTPGQSFVDDVHILSPNLLSLLYQMKLLFESRQNIFIFGPKKSGKTTLL
jgi:hypothetical protein